MRDVIAELKALRLHGMAGTWADLIEQNNAEWSDRAGWSSRCCALRRPSAPRDR